MRTPACLLRIRQARTGLAGRSGIIDRIAVARIFGRVAGLLLAFVALQPGLALAQTINQEAKLLPPLTAGAGTSVSISGDTAVVGAPGDGGKGAVYVFVRDPLTNTWAPQQTLTASDGVAGDLFGHAVSISGNNIAVGAAGRNSNTGAVYGFNRSGTTWTQGPILTTGPAGSKLGYSVSVQGLTLIVGAPYTTIGAKTNVGNAYAYTSLDGGLTWQQQFVLQVVTGQAKSGDHIGWSVSLSGNTALVGQTVTVTVSVTPVAPGAGAPTGLVTITDDVDLVATCTITLSLASSCTLSLNALGTSNLTATYAGDPGFNGSVSATESHTVTIPAGNHLVFVPPSPSDVLRGNQLNGVTVQIQDATNAVVTTDNSTQVTLSVTACGAPVLFGPVTVTAGIADFTGIGPRFYTVTSTPLLLNADAAGYTTATSGSFNVLANADIVFADGFDGCRL